jgi:sterol desaturase/sphingolipid hydroxylase (fatty acid hydroxylase superfamily)
VLGNFLYVAGTLLALSLAFVLPERLFPAQRGHKARRWLLNVAYVPVIAGLALLLASALAGPAILALSRASGGLLPAAIAWPGSWGGRLVVVLGYAFLWDLCQYGSHRLLHGSALLWETHRFHHDETELSAASQSRVHPLSYVIVFLLQLPVLAVFAVGPRFAAAAFLVLTLWGFVNHANVRLSFGPLTPVVAGPQWHRIHHSALPEHQGRNFAVLFPAIDILFGTYYRPARGEYPPTGVPGPQAPWIEAATWGPLAAWRRMGADALRRSRTGSRVRGDGGVAH